MQQSRRPAASTHPHAEPSALEFESSTPGAPGGGRWISGAVGLDSVIPSPSLPRPAGERPRLDSVLAPDRQRAALPQAPSIFRPAPSRRQSLFEQEVLSDASVDWLAKVPPALRPVELARQFPRILNHLSRLWSDPVQWDRYLHSLLIDNRDGSRAGFPPKVATELARLFSIHAPPEAVEEPWRGPRDRV